ncbi:MAG: polyribonucleotide nucleotidyltransferase, partial [FCB group bacterium]
MSKQTVSIDIDGRSYSLETGRFAKFANGSVLARSGDTMVLVTVVAESEAKPEMDYMPLQVEYREKAASAGKIPGGFLRREGGKPSDHEVIISRLIDRPIRPMFPKTWRFDTQIIATVYSSDPEVDPDTIAAIGASAALMVSDIPYTGPISEVRVGRINGELVLNPSKVLLKDSDLDMTIAGTDTSIVMVEGESHEISEGDFLEVLEFAHSRIKLFNDLQKQLANLINPTKREFIEPEIPEEIKECVKNAIHT